MPSENADTIQSLKRRVLNRRQGDENIQNYHCCKLRIINQTNDEIMDDGECDEGKEFETEQGNKSLLRRRR
jgi:hypothetical protein